jgi:hypothetical protein
VEDDHRLLEEGMVIYDALYAWSSRARGQRHDWRPADMIGEAKRG